MAQTIDSLETYPLRSPVTFVRVSGDRDVQAWFDVGMAHCFNFNRPEAILCFRSALKLNKTKGNRCFAFCTYGIAYASGVDYNKPEFLSDEEAMCAYESAQRCVSAAKGLRHRSSGDCSDDAEIEDVWLAIFDALRTRYANPPPNEPCEYDRLNRRYVEAMAKVHDKFADTCPEVSALYAEALMQLRPWNLWERREHGNDAMSVDSDTLTIKRTLERALRKWPNHPGLCHFFIHLMEMSDEPAVALPQCDVLRKLWSKFGHLAHMPSHIDMQVGGYGAAVEANRLGIAADLELLRYRGSKSSFYFGYFLHNVHMHAWAAMFEGNFEAAMRSATQIVDETPKSIVRAWAPDVENYLAIKWHVLVRFGKWQRVIQEPLRQEIDGENIYPVCIATGLYAKGIACAALGRTAEAEKYQKRFSSAVLRVPAEARLHNVRSHLSLEVADRMLDGEIKFRLQNFDDAFASLRSAVRLEDALPYDEPWGWMMPSRHALGALLLERGRVDESERVFRKDLERYPENLWALTGLLSCARRRLRDSKRAHDDDELLRRSIDRFQNRVARASRGSDVVVRAACFCAENDDNGPDVCCKKRAAKRRKTTSTDIHSTTHTMHASCYATSDQDTWADLRKILTRPTAWSNGTSTLCHPYGAMQETDDGEIVAIDNATLRVDASDGEAYAKESFDEVYGANSAEWRSATPAGLHCLATKKVLVVGAGGLGCELMKNLALSGVKNIHIIDADTIDVTNLNRQFLFRRKDVGKGKAQIAAAFVKRIVPDVNVTTETCFVQSVHDPDGSFYRQFDLVICGLDNVEAREWMSKKLHDLVAFKPDPSNGSTTLDTSSIVPMIDGGTEGLGGQTHVIIPYCNANFKTRFDEQFTPRPGVASCTIATNPRKPEHCVVYAKSVLWPKMAKEMVVSGQWKEERQPDTDSQRDVQWINKAAQAHAKKFNMDGIDYDFTMGVVKNIIPAVPCSNAITAASCTAEAIKLLTLCGRSMNNNMLIKGGNYSNVTQLTSGGHNEWARSLRIQAIVLTSKKATVAEFVRSLENHRVVHEHLARFNVAYLMAGADADDDATAQDNGELLVRCVRTNVASLSFDFECDTLFLKVPTTTNVTVGHVLRTMHDALGETSAAMCGRMCLVIAQGSNWQTARLRVFLDEDEALDISVPFSRDRRLFAIPRLTADDPAGRRGITSLDFSSAGGPCIRIAGSMMSDLSRTLEDIGDVHGKEVIVSDARMHPGRLSIFPFIREHEQGRRFADAMKEEGGDSASF